MGMTLNGTDIRTSNIKFDLVRGYAEPAEVRGEDTVVPGKDGRTVRDRVADKRSILLEGYVRGTGASLTAEQQSWRSSTDALMALLDRTASPVNLVISDPYYGLSASATKTIAVRCVNVIPGPISASRFQRWSIELESVAPDWS